MDRSLASLQLGAGILVRPNLVAHSHRTVAGGRTPIALTAWLERYRAIDNAHTGYAGRRVLPIIWPIISTVLRSIALFRVSSIVWRGWSILCPYRGRGNSHFSSQE